MTNAIAIEPVAVIAERPCNFCELNNSGTYNEKSFRAVTHDVESVGRAPRQRQDAWKRARQELGLDLQLEPWKTGLDDATLWPPPPPPEALP